VGQIAQSLAIARLLLAFGLDQQVQVLGDGAQFARVDTLELLAGTGLDLLEITSETAQR